VLLRAEYVVSVKVIHHIWHNDVFHEFWCYACEWYWSVITWFWHVSSPWEQYRCQVTSEIWLLLVLLVLPWHRDNVCLVLRCYATCVFLQIVGDCRRRHCHGVKGGEASDYLLDLNYYILRFPITDRQNKLMKDDCHAIARFPSVISAVDGTHIRIIEPQNYVENYVNRNINVHVLCDHREVTYSSVMI